MACPPDAAGRLLPLLPYSFGYAEPFVMSQARCSLPRWDLVRTGSFALNALPHPDLLTPCIPCPFCDAFFTCSVMLLLQESKHIINIHLPPGFPPGGLHTHPARTAGRLRLRSLEDLGRIFISFPPRLSSGSWAPRIGPAGEGSLVTAAGADVTRAGSAWFCCFPGLGADTQPRPSCHLQGLLLNRSVLPRLVVMPIVRHPRPSAPGPSFLFCSCLPNWPLHLHRQPSQEQRSRINPGRGRGR